MCMLTTVFPSRVLTNEEFTAAKMLFTNIMLANSSNINKDGTGFITMSGKRARWTDDASSAILHGDFVSQLHDSLQHNEAIIGHVRATSVGAVNLGNTHPFHHNGIAMAHNGTFSNYKELLKTTSVTTKDPTDSLVVSKLLGDEVNNKEMTFNHIKTVSDKTTGSYALLLLDIPHSNMWVVRGCNSLYIAKIGPLHIINTNKLSLEAAVKNAELMAKIYNNSFWEVGDIIPLDVYTAYTLDADGLHEQGTLSAPKKIVTKTYYTTEHTTNKREDTAGERAKLISDLMVTLDTMSLSDVNYICVAAFGINWWELPYSLLGAFVSSMLYAHTLTTDKKDELWVHLQKLYDGEATEALDILHDDLELPYYLNPTAALQQIITDLGVEQ